MNGLRDQHATCWCPKSWIRTARWPKCARWQPDMHDDVIKWKHFPRNWPFVRKIHRSPVNFPHKGQWRGALMFSLIYVWMNDWANNREAGDLRRQHGHYDVIVMWNSVPHHWPFVRRTTEDRRIPLKKGPVMWSCVFSLFSAIREATTFV